MGDAKAAHPKKFCDMDLEMGDAKECSPHLQRGTSSIIKSGQKDTEASIF